MNIILNLLRNNEKLKKISKENYQERIQTIEDELFISVYHTVETSLLTNDKLLTALKFVQMRLGHKYADEFKLLLETPTIMETSWFNILENILNKR